MIDLQAVVGAVHERALLEYVRSRIPAGTGVVIGVGDDAAAVETGPVTLITTDSLVEGVHFTRDWTPPQLLGRKALSVNLSDIGAMAGVPRHAVISLCLPVDLPLAFLDLFYDGLLERAAQSNVNLVGGNLAATRGPIVIDLTLLGQGDKFLRRSGAVAGDVVVITGSLGAAAAGLELLRQGARLGEDGEVTATGIWTDTSKDAVRHCLRAQLDPTPPIALGRALVEQDMAHAAIDISDGLSLDLVRICEESGVGAKISGDLLPVDAAASGLARAQGTDPFPLALHGGEDYQLALAIPRDKLEEVSELGRVFSIAITAIGEFTPGEPVVMMEHKGETRRLEVAGYEHFKAE
jgi:thiamine-monophosphate kinase